MEINLGLVCMLTTTKFKKGFSGLKSLKSSLKIEDKLKKACLHNIEETIKCLTWCINNKIFLYRISSEIIPFNEFWTWKDDIDILKGLNKIQNLALKNNIILTIHPDQFCVLNSLNEKVVDNSIKILEYHYELSLFLGIKYIILHTGSSVHEYESRFIETCSKLNKNILDKLCLENCHSINILSVISICKRLKIKPLIDFHHNRICGNIDIDSILSEILELWNNKKPLAHLSSGKNFSNDKKHNDFISKEDIVEFEKYFYKFNIEIEAKQKEKAILKIKSFFNLL